MHEDSELAAETATTPSAVPSPDRVPTIHDVARVAGVSSGTVSRYLNGHKWVADTSAEAIKAAIDATGYRRNRFARSLATGRSSTAVFLLTEPQDRLFGDPNYPILLREITTALADRGITLVLMTASEDDERRRVMDFVRGGHIQGVLLVSSHVDDPMTEQLARAGVPTVSCGRPIGWESSIASVAADDRAGARIATEHLITLGRRRIGFITGPLDISGAIDRLDGYTDALAAAGIPLDPALIAHGDWLNVSGRAAMTELLTTAPDIDAVFASNDLMASGAITTLRAAGRTVPGDVAVVGFDDSGLAATTDPPLTTMRQPFAEISREMVRLLTERVPGEAPAVTLPALLVTRESSAAL
ncbi:LacI family DNA-binding transcriptional regulator [Microbacterium thalassium]|uniref:DNA-binding LacI/PurR family transcriptional regulator n=1 Tax=Microbacterium thalassium TaxID=362649 RepID=A0A7X0FN54_9MICO|nr:LacI family DNA-binding transcriptional regulator [Microbacterium thalassium]MBB6390575.1 DNA-binding LacI/PurR family transcriptional regulator [Microbacterium thalassium]GLK25686.1 LacI family transcriptional regulator [Microbacterium thalassium]